MVPLAQQVEAPHALTASPLASPQALGRLTPPRQPLAEQLPAAIAPFAAAMRLHQNITCRQVVLLAIVADEPGLSIGPIAKRMGVQKPLVTRNAQVLADFGLLHIRRDEDDLRRRRLMATSTGLAVLDLITRAKG